MQIIYANVCIRNASNSRKKLSKITLRVTLILPFFHANFGHFGLFFVV